MKNTEESPAATLSPAEREEMVTYVTEKVSEWHDAVHPGVVVLNDASAVPMGMALKEAWRTAYGSDDTPRWLRIDPRAFTADATSVDEALKQQRERYAYITEQLESSSEQTALPQGLDDDLIQLYGDTFGGYPLITEFEVTLNTLDSTIGEAKVEAEKAYAHITNYLQSIRKKLSDIPRNSSILVYDETVPSIQRVTSLDESYSSSLYRTESVLRGEGFYNIRTEYGSPSAYKLPNAIRPIKKRSFHLNDSSMSDEEWSEHFLDSKPNRTQSQQYIQEMISVGREAGERLFENVIARMIHPKQDAYFESNPERITQRFLNNMFGKLLRLIAEKMGKTNAVDHRPLCESRHLEPPSTNSEVRLRQSSIQFSQTIWDVARDVGLQVDDLQAEIQAAYESKDQARIAKTKQKVEAQLPPVYRELRRMGYKHRDIIS